MNILYIHVQRDIRAAKGMQITESQKQRPSCPIWGTRDRDWYIRRRALWYI